MGFPAFTKTVSLAFLWTLLGEVFQTFYNLTLLGELPVHTRFDNLDLVSRSQVCQNHELQSVVSIFVRHSLNVVWFLHTLKIYGTVCFV